VHRAIEIREKRRGVLSSRPAAGPGLLLPGQAGGQVLIPPASARAHPADLLLWSHHYQASRVGLEPSVPWRSMRDGSAFNLEVLGALGDAVAAGTVRWNQPLW
jgi:hypothetical protein